MRSAWGTVVMLGLALVTPASAASVEDDDLAVVKRATKQEGAQGGVEKTERVEKARATVRRSGQPQWLRVRVVERGGKRKVSVNLPLALVRALGDDFDLGLLCGHNGRRHRDDHDVCPELKLADVL